MQNRGGFPGRGLSTFRGGRPNFGEFRRPEPPRFPTLTATFTYPDGRTQETRLIEEPTFGDYNLDNAILAYRTIKDRLGFKEEFQIEDFGHGKYDATLVIHVMNMKEEEQRIEKVALEDSEEMAEKQVKLLILSQMLRERIILELPLEMHKADVAIQEQQLKTYFSDATVEDLF